MKRFGTEYGGFYYPENLDGLDENSIIYCIGAGEDISHDIMIANKLNSNVYIIDPTPRAIEHYNHVKNVYEENINPNFSNKFGGGEPYKYWNLMLENKIDTSKIIYKDYGVGINEGIQKFYLPTNEEHVSCSLVEGMKGNKYIDVNVKKLKTIMKELGHNKIDLLKMDIEGSECDVIKNMLEEQIYSKYLAVKFDNTLKKENTKYLLEKNNYKLLYQDNNNYVYKYNINICIIHIGYKKYLEENIKITSKTNKIYLIGDKSVKCLEKYENVEYIDIEEFIKNEKINFYKSKYVNYANYDFNWIWIAGPGRIFTIQLFLEKYKFNHIFNIDSDCILLKDINNYPFKQDIAYCINQNYENKYRMSNSIHSALLDKNFCIKFEKLYNDLYINKTKFKLIEDKINYHKNNNISGGICEMTLCYLLQNENYISVDNLLEIKNHNNTKLTFMNTLYSNESSENKDQYLKENNIIKIYDINGEKYIYDKINQEYIELWNIHYQGDCKILLQNNIDIIFKLENENILNKKRLSEKDNLEFTEDNLKYYIDNIYKSSYNNNEGGMGAPDLFSLWFILNKYKPKIVIESGVWNGISTKLIRETLPNSKIICLDPRHIPQNGYKDNNINTKYFLGENFIDFSDLDISNYNSDDILCFFDCHQNAYLRVLQCIEKNINKIFLNDNYPENCGSHYTLEHLKKNDRRLYSINNDDKEKLLSKIINYHIFPNIYPGKIKTGEGYFDCNSFFKENNNIDYLDIFRIERNKYRWNTFILLDI